MIAAARFTPARRRFAGIVLVSALSFVAEGATFAVLGPYARDRIGAGSDAAGLVLGLGTVAALAARAVVAGVVDRRGPRGLMVVGLLLVSAAGPLYAAAASVPALVVPRLLQGAGQAAVFTSGLAWAIAIAPAARRGQVIGLYGLCVWSGLAVGPVLGAALRATGGFTAVWVLVTLVPLPGLVVLWRLGRSPRTRSTPRTGPLIPRAALVPGVALGLGTVGHASVLGFTVLALDARGVEGSALVLAAFSVTAAVARITLGHLPDRNAQACLVVSSIAGAGGLALLAVAQSTAVAIVGAAGFGLAWAFLYPALALLVIRRVADDARGAAIATFSASFDIGFSGAAPLLGLIGAHAGYGPLFLAAGIAVALVAPVARLAGRGTA